MVLQATAHRHLAQQPEEAGSGSGQGKHTHLSAAMQGYEAACSMDEKRDQAEGPLGLAEIMAEAALKLALLCKELLQVNLCIARHCRTCCALMSKIGLSMVGNAIGYPGLNQTMPNGVDLSFLF